MKFFPLCRERVTAGKAISAGSRVEPAPAFVRPPSWLPGSRGPLAATARPNRRAEFPARSGGAGGSRQEHARAGWQVAAGRQHARTRPAMRWGVHCSSPLSLSRTRIAPPGAAECLKIVRPAGVQPYDCREHVLDVFVGETDHPRETVEALPVRMAQNEVEAAYLRADLFVRRRWLRVIGLPVSPAGAQTGRPDAYTTGPNAVSGRTGWRWSGASGRRR